MLGGSPLGVFAEREMDHSGALGYVSRCTSTAELAAVKAAIEERTRALEADAGAPPAKRGRPSLPTEATASPRAAEDIPALARTPVSAADVAGKTEIRLLLNVSLALAAPSS